ncbi:hypothetical protein [Actinokineospora sp. NBRC 105648]|uniref:hypothetical protein n=1 Tax=Actinokineospora sp. NBRC 105648 TaxID=3032206 RepID=UPI0024A06FF0|nr:hypothetical protein [Actinokineospora sp. NBRC 105648]GLZ38730.1 hypothetical protein Acsp05_23540 [Actinokineospora sp. NBRC 105648]
MSYEVPALPPCLPGCRYALDRITDLADRVDGSHTCVVTVAVVESIDRTPVYVQVVRWFDAEGLTEPAFVELRGGDLVGDDGFGALAARELGAAFAAAAALIDSAAPP